MNLPAHAFTTHDSAQLPEVAIVEAGLDEFNSQVLALRDVQPLVVLCRAEDGHVLAGAVGRTWGQCCELQQLWVTPSCRKLGLGSAVTHEFEQAAAARGVRTVYLYTFSFQAPSFYAKLGYAVALELRGFSEGVSKFTMVKQLVPNETAA